MGDASEVNIGPISQAIFIGSANYATTGNCEWSRTNTALGAYTADADCPAPTIELNPGPGTISTSDADLPQFTVNNLPPGNYLVLMSGGAVIPGATVDMCHAINDGTTTAPAVCQVVSTTVSGPLFVSGHFNYTTAGSRTFALYTSSSSSTSALRNRAAQQSLSFKLYRYPNSFEQAYNPSLVPFLWRGKHANGCSMFWTSTSGHTIASGDASSCSLSDMVNVNAGTVTATMNGALSITPGIVFNAPRAGVYDIKSDIQSNPSSNISWSYRMMNGANILHEVINESTTTGVTMTDHLFGRVTINSVGRVQIDIYGRVSSSTVTAEVQSPSSDSPVYWTVTEVTQTMPMPLLVNSVTSQLSSVLAFESATINCDAGSAITSQDGSWVSSVGNISAGACVVTLTAGAFSSTPRCFAQDIAVAGDPSSISAVATSATSVTVDCVQAGGTTDCTAYDFNLYCRAGK
jgi:hypothetical protein